ncbi:MAG: S24/S26 family peptidase [archaeon]
MRLKLFFLALALAFVVGWMSSYIYINVSASSTELPMSGNKSMPSPYDRVPESSIHVYPDKVVIDMDNVQWASYADTHSMEPVLRAGANGLELIPKSDSDIHVGDIVAYNASWADGLIVHRVIDSGYDAYGTYYTLKGDNNSSADPGKVRFSQVEYVLIGVIY